VRLYGTINNTKEAIDKLIRKLVSTGAELHFVYEGGPCGFGLYRHLTGNGFGCNVAALSMVSKKSGIRIKNHSRNALAFARLLRAVELSPIYVPDTEDEAFKRLLKNRKWGGLFNLTLSDISGKNLILIPTPTIEECHI
jgi:transposase